VKRRRPALKDTNPKDAVGTGKVPISTVSFQVLGEVGLAMLEGARKYGRHNYRVAGVRASVYFDAVVMRHLGGWWEGEDLDPDTGLSHVTKAIAALCVLRDSMLQGNWVDDRPPAVRDTAWIQRLNDRAKALIAKYPSPPPAYTRSSSLTSGPQPRRVRRQRGKASADPRRDSQSSSRSARTSR
jgi:hypothetical protein